MTSLNRYKDHAIVLRTSQLRESDLIVTLLGITHGKISAVARGVRRSRRRFMGGVDVFDCGIFEIEKPKKEAQLYTLSLIQQQEAWNGLRNNLRTFSLASLVLEVANTFAAEGDPDSRFLFAPLYQCLKRLNEIKSEDEHSLTVIVYLLHVLERSGFGPLENRQDITVRMRSWWDSLLNQPLATLPHDFPHDRKLVDDSFTLLISLIEQIVGKPLNTLSTQLGQDRNVRLCQ